jgi:hypothetical protein
MPQNQRTRWTQDEKGKVVARMIEIARADPNLEESEIFHRAYKSTLAPDRHPKAKGKVPRYRYAAMLAEMYATLGKSPGRDAPAAPKPCVTTPCPPPTPSPKELAHSLVESLFTREDRDRSLESEVRRLREDLDAMKDTLARTHEQVGQFHGILTKILGDLSGYAPAAEPTTLPVAIVPTEPEVIRKPKPSLPVIGLIGPLPDQAEAIRRRVGDSVDLRFFDKEHNITHGMLKNCDWIVITVHSRHHNFYKAHDAVGRDRVVRLPSGGVVVTSEKIVELATAPSPNGKH